MGLYEERFERIKKAIRFEPVDKIPVVPCANAYWARRKGIRMKDYINDYDLACDTNIACMEEIKADATQNVIFSPWLLGTQWLSKTAVPGEGLGDDEMWQVLETENMRFEEYHEILDHGFEPFLQKFMKEKCNDNFAKLQPFFEAAPRSYEKFQNAGIPCICDFLMITPFEFFCGGRSLETFFTEDLFDEPELMDEVFAKVMEYTIPTYRQQIKDTHAVGVWIGGWRTAPEMLNPQMWERFVWPYFKQYTKLCIEMDVIPIFHLDANWDNGIEKFLEMPEKKCILALDSKTDIRRARKILGEHMCILGDVPCELLSFGTAEEVYTHTEKLIDDVGPWGYIVASGCDIPSDAKPENVMAMSTAAHDYLDKHGVK